MSLRHRGEGKKDLNSINLTLSAQRPGVSVLSTIYFTGSFQKLLMITTFMCACVRACVYASVSMCVRACVRACVLPMLLLACSSVHEFLGATHDSLQIQLTRTPKAVTKITKQKIRCSRVTSHCQPTEFGHSKNNFRFSLKHYSCWSTTFCRKSRRRRKQPAFVSSSLGTVRVAACSFSSPARCRGR